MARGMNLKFLKNPLQRTATGKTLPLKQIEAIVAYGRPEQRTQVVEKVIVESYLLALNRETSHILLTILQHCDNTVRVRMLYHLRRKVRDLAMSPVGNTIVQALLDKCPNQQKKEIAECFIRNVEKDTLKELCMHRFGNHVAARLVEFPAAAEQVEESLVPYLSALATHPYGQFVIAKYVEHVEGGVGKVVTALFGSGALEENTEDSAAESDLVSRVSTFLGSVTESAVVAALIKHPLTPEHVKDTIVAHLCEYVKDYLVDGRIAGSSEGFLDEFAGATGGNGDDDDEFALPDFGNQNIAASAGGGQKAAVGQQHGKRPSREAAGGQTHDSDASHHFAYIAALEHGDDGHREAIFAALLPLLPHVVSKKSLVAVALSAFQYAPQTSQQDSRTTIIEALFTSFPAADGETGTPLSASDVAQDPVRTLLLRGIIKTDLSLLSAARQSDLIENAVALAQVPTASPVLQLLVEHTGDDDVKQRLFDCVKGEMRQLALHASASYFIQALLQYTGGAARSEVVRSVLSGFQIATTAPTSTEAGSAAKRRSSEKKSTAAASALVDIRDAVSTKQGSCVLQKLLAYATDEEVRSVADVLLASEESVDAVKELHQFKVARWEQHDKEEEKSAASQKPLSARDRREINRQRTYTVEGKGLINYALNANACYVVRALLQECRTRLMDSHRKRLMNALKPFVFELSVSPWAGRIVLDTMLQAGSSQLAEAMKNVVYLKAESWLTSAPEHGKSHRSVDPTLRQAMKRERTDGDSNKPLKAPRTGATGSSTAPVAAPAKPKAAKIFKSLKK